MNDLVPATGCTKSPYDVRTFAFPTTGNYIQKAGERYKPEDIRHQSKVGICTAISLTQNALKATGVEYSADYQYLEQKLATGNWDEGSSLFTALGVAKNIGLLPVEHWTYTTQADRDLPYHEYIAKLKAVPKSEIEKLRVIAGKNKIKAYASVPVDRDAIAEAISTSRAGVLARYDIGKEWWTDKNGIVTWNKDAIEPLRAPKLTVSGHAVTISNIDGSSVRIPNTWSKEWADGGTAYHSLKNYLPTEVWHVWYEIAPTEIEKQLENRKKLQGQILDALQKLVALLTQLKNE